MNEEQYYECGECAYSRIDEETGEWYCKKTYAVISPECSACEDFELDD